VEKVSNRNLENRVHIKMDRRKNCANREEDSRLGSTVKRPQLKGEN